MRVLIAGGAGYIGSVVSQAFVADGHQVVVLDDLSKGHRDAVWPACKLIVGNVGDSAALESVFSSAQFDGVVHLAASIEAGESMQHPEKFFRNNSANTLGLLEKVLQHRVPHFVFSSTAALYGNPERTPIEETDPLVPTNAYGESKLLVERMLEWFHRIHGLRSASLRYFNAAGATEALGEDHHPETHLIPLVLQAASGQRDGVSVFGTDYPTPDGTCVRDYIHVADLADAHVLAFRALCDARTSERLIYNLGNGKGFSVREVVSAAEQVTGKKIKVTEAPRRSGDPAILVASSAKIQHELGWKPQHADLLDILASAWNWRLAHPNGYGR